jgi:DNA-binding GntR family transcriptional regulator
MGNNRNLSDETYQKLLEKIITNELKPGDFLNEQVLTKKLHVSRTPYRAAINRLHTMQLLEIEAGRAPRVRQFSLDDITSLVETLIVIEKTVAKMAAQRATASDIQKLRRANESVVKAASTGDPKDYVYKNEHFHRAIAEAAHNPFISQVHYQLRVLMQQLTYSALERAKSGPGGVLEYYRTLSDQHSEITDSIERRDSTRAEELSVEHLKIFHANIITHFTRLDVY